MNNNNSRHRSRIFNGELISFERGYLSTYVKCALCILILYYLNFLIGFQSYFWSEKSFENEFYSRILHIDVVQEEENPLKVLGEPTNLLSNQFRIENEYLCGYASDPSTIIYPHLLLFIKSNIKHFKQRQAIRHTEMITGEISSLKF
jgi:hypothetical protein